MSVPLLSFPPNVIDQILSSIFSEDQGVYDIVEIGILSKRCTRIVQSLTTPITGFDFYVDAKTTTLISRIGDQKTGVFYFRKRGTVIRYGERHPLWRLCCGYAQYLPANQKSIKADVEKVLALFDRPILNVRLHLESIPATNYRRLIPFDSCERVTIVDNRKHSNVRSLIEKCNASKWIRVAVSVAPRFQMNFKNIKVLELDGTVTECVNPKKVQDLSIVKLTGCQWKVEDLEEMIQNWWKASDGLKYLEILLTEKPKRELNLRTYRAKKWNEKRRDEYLIHDIPKAPGHRLSLAKGLDIERADGTLATVLLEDKKFIFAVWNNRFPVSSLPLVNYMMIDVESDDDEDFETDDDSGESSDDSYVSGEEGEDV